MSEAASSERSLGSSTGLLLVGRLVGNAGYFVAVLIVARSLGPEGRGAIAFVTVTALVAAAVAALGAPSAVSVLVHERADKRAELLTASVALTTVTGLGAGIIAFGGMLGLGVGQERGEVGVGGGHAGIMADGPRRQEGPWSPPRTAGSASPPSPWPRRWTAHCGCPPRRRA